MDHAHVDAVDRRPWYHGVTRYQWLVLAIASAGWVFDVYEGQVFAVTRHDMLAEVLGGQGVAIAKYSDVFNGIFLVGGMVGGLAAGSLADRFGRRPIMIATILFYSLFSGLNFFAQELWHVATLRFLVAVGVGGEWAVAASLVAEIFPARARAHASGIFHASSVLGTWMATLAGMAVGAQWRYAYLVGVLPALLIVWVRASVREPERWQAESRQSPGEQTFKRGSFVELLTTSPWNRRAWLGLGLAAVGLGTFWAVTLAGQDLARSMLEQSGRKQVEVARESQFAYGFVQTAGGGLGLLSFGPLAARIGRRRTFLLFHLLAFAVTLLTCFAPQTYGQLLAILPLFGFFTLGIHAGYAIYFPELFPTRLRATGSSFCFNGGRVVAAPLLFFSGSLKAGEVAGLRWLDLRSAVACLSALFLIGAAIALLMPETKGQELPE